MDAQIADQQKAKGDLQEKYPQITGIKITPSESGGSSGGDLETQTAQVTALQAKIKVWDEQLDQLQMEATNLNSVAPVIAQLEQTKAIQEANYEHLATGIEKSHIDQALDTGKAPNIKWVQQPSPPNAGLEKNL